MLAASTASATLAGPDIIELVHAERLRLGVLAEVLRGFEHGLGNPGIGAAAAEIAAHGFADALGISAGLRFRDQADRAHDLAGRAEAALKAVMGDERGLHGMQLLAARDALDGEDVGAVMADGQRQARIDPPAVDQHGAGAALAAVASLLGPGELKPLAQEVEQRDAGVVERRFRAARR